MKNKLNANKKCCLGVLKFKAHNKMNKIKIKAENIKIRANLKYINYIPIMLKITNDTNHSGFNSNLLILLIILK